MKKVLYRIFVFIVLSIIIINIFSMFHISIFGLRLFRVGTGSMVPYLNINDYIIIKKSNNYEVGDVVTYKVDDLYITHRIVSISENGVVTKGDANNIVDPVVEKNNIVGKVILRLGFVGFIFYLFSKIYTWVLLFVIGLLITIFIPDKKKKIK